MKKLLIATLAVVLAGVSINSYADTATSNLGVSASIAATCTISTSPAAFGAYDPVVTHKSAPLDVTGTVTTTCTNGSAVLITLGQGANADTGSDDATPLRRVKSGSNYLSYFLYSDTGRTTEWGNDTSSVIPDPGPGAASALTIYGRMPADQNMPVGSYTDTVVATVTF